jgi:hypothetical protein
MTIDSVGRYFFFYYHSFGGYVRNPAIKTDVAGIDHELTGSAAIVGARWPLSGPPDEYDVYGGKMGVGIVSKV